MTMQHLCSQVEENEDVIDDSPNRFVCNLCGTNFHKQHDLVKCTTSHKIPTDLKCESCKLYFANAAQLGTHEVLFHAIEDDGEEIEAEEIDDEEVDGEEEDDEAFEDSD